MKTTDPIKNDENVIAIAKSGEVLEYRFGQLKQDFQSKKLKVVITRVYVPRTKKSYFINFTKTKGCKFERISSEELK